MNSRGTWSRFPFHLQPPDTITTLWRRCVYRLAGRDPGSSRFPIRYTATKTRQKSGLGRQETSHRTAKSMLRETVLISADAQKYTLVYRATRDVDWNIGTSCTSTFVVTSYLVSVSPQYLMVDEKARRTGSRVVCVFWRSRRSTRSHCVYPRVIPRSRESSRVLRRKRRKGQRGHLSTVRGGVLVLTMLRFAVGVGAGRGRGGADPRALRMAKDYAPRDDGRARHRGA